MTPIERQWHIIERLDTRRFDTLPHLADEFGVSYDTISRDIMQLSLVFPISTSTGKYGGVFVADYFHLSRKHLTTQQRTTLLKIAESLSSEDKEIVNSILLDFALT